MRGMSYPPFQTMHMDRYTYILYTGVWKYGRCKLQVNNSVSCCSLKH